ncbi:fractalkine isoform X1 [Rousettus aegyptiacus]|uniref:C-X3-C motif chemokine ligand 1 n=1 Tax=Rousettus aegyptiacus TaxID=9407 RepID=A0A7J8CFG7_ROUAE|nr:fractalkine isoform X1 [Rousettus aegyptiacus]KAF6409532.1 C-X3-C motif chemokine ligand 1 [Rousettus aegyptiacus]
MALPPLSWLLRLAAICHLTMLLAGQHHGVKKCSITCSGKISAEIPEHLLMSYRQNRRSCGKPAIILETKNNRLVCADPKAEWVRKAMEYLDRKGATEVHNGSTFQRQISMSGPRNTSLAAGAMDRSAVSEPKATGESSSQEVHGALGTSPELPTGVPGSWGPMSPTVSKAPDGGPPDGPERTDLYNSAAVTSTTSWQSSADYQPGSDLQAEGKASEAPSAPAPSTQASSTQALPTQAPSTQAASTQTPSTQAPSTQTLPTQAPSTQAPTTPEDNIGPMWTKGQNLMPENSIGPREMGPISAHMDALTGPSSTPHASAVPVSSEGAPGRESVATGSPFSQEIIHATQRLGVISTPVPDSPAATRRQAVGLLAFLGLLFCLGMAMFAYQSLQGCPHKIAGDMAEGLRYVPRSCGSNSYVLVPV